MASPIADYLLALADDELILGHRASEWCGHAPILEEDIAFANLALDEIGHARLWLELAAKEMGEDPAKYPDQQVYFRAPDDFRNSQLVELPNGDWAFTMLRQYMFDAFETQRLDALSAVNHSGMAEVAASIRNEELYHLRHTQAWVRRLALGTEESAARSQAALNALWPYAQQLAQPLPGESQDVPSSSDIFDAWRNMVVPFIEECVLIIPEVSGFIGDRTQHSDHLAPMIADMQEVARVEPEAIW